VTVYRFVERERTSFPVATMCRTLGVSPSGFWAWAKRPPSTRALADEALTATIREIHKDSRGTYGIPRVHAELRFGGTRCSRKRVARLMRAAGLEGVHRRRFVRTTVRDRDAAPAPDLVNRRFTASRPDQLWVADITYLPTWQGFLYLAAVVDVFSRAVVGWAMAGHLRTELILDAIEMATSRRRPSEGLIHHSDRGTQYTSIAFGLRCREAGIVLSMGSTGDAYDNAMAESFFATLETELIDRSSWRTRADARLAVFDYIEAFYNPRRRHSGLGHLSPHEFERRYRSQTISDHAVLLS
jgi:putative transposase